MMLESFIYVTFNLALFIGVLLVLRRPVLWYFRVNEHLDNQRRIIALLQRLSGVEPDTDTAGGKDGRGKRKKAG